MVEFPYTGENAFVNASLMLTKQGSMSLPICGGRWFIATTPKDFPDQGLLSEV